MTTNTLFFIGIGLALIVLLITVFVWCVENTKELYINKFPKRNEVDEEIEKELRNEMN